MNNANVCKSCCGVIRNMTLTSGKYAIIVVILITEPFILIDESKITAGQIGAIETVIKAMYMHMNSANVCESACGALRNITTIGKIFIYFYLMNVFIFIII